MTKTAKEIIEYLEKRYKINNSTKNYIVDKIEKALKSAYADGKTNGRDGGCDCGQPSCSYCN